MQSTTQGEDTLRGECPKILRITTGVNHNIIYTPHATFLEDAIAKPLPIKG